MLGWIYDQNGAWQKPQKGTIETRYRGGLRKRCEGHRDKELKEDGNGQRNHK